MILFVKTRRSFDRKVNEGLVFQAIVDLHKNVITKLENKRPVLVSRSCYIDHSRTKQSLDGMRDDFIRELKTIDPDSNVEGSGAGRGIVYFNNPGSRSYLFTIKLNF